MARFETAVIWVMQGGYARRKNWACVMGFTPETPPIAKERKWHIWCHDATNAFESIVQGWGGQVGAELSPNDPIRDGTLYIASDEDRVATDWECYSGTKR